jgi:uncharacterized membrane protein YhaH (DUF805 family)
MGFKEAITTVFVEKYALMFQGRASRSEYWWSVLGLMLLIAVPLGLVLLATGIDSTGINLESLSAVAIVLIILVSSVAYILLLFAMTPMFAVGVRRFHDRDMSGWWALGFFLLAMIPFVGIVTSIINLVIFCLRGTDGENRFVADPLRGGSTKDVFS